MNRGPEKIGRFLGAMIVIALCLLLSSCSTYRLSTLNYDPVYGPEEVVLTVPSDVKIDTINSYFQLRNKLRKDFNFRWDFAQYAMNQPYNWYWSNPRLESLWRPYNRFDVYFYSNWFWSDWAFGYPYHSYYSWNNWYRPWGWNSWNRPYNPWNNWYQGPWHNPGYNVVWNSSRRGERNIAYINGPRGSRGNSIIQRDNNNIENRIIVNRNKPRNNVNDIDLIVNNLREKINKPIRVYNNPNNVINNNNNNNNNNIIRVKPNNNNNNINNNNIRGSWRPNNNSNSSNNIYTRPPVNNSSNVSRGSSSSVNSAGSSRGGNSNRRN
jgi:hypothetical protein